MRIRKNDSTLFNIYADDIIEELESGWTDLGGGNTIFYPIPALQAVINYCQKELDYYKSKEEK